MECSDDLGHRETFARRAIAQGLAHELAAAGVEPPADLDELALVVHCLEDGVPIQRLLAPGGTSDEGVLRATQLLVAAWVALTREPAEAADEPGPWPNAPADVGLGSRLQQDGRSGAADSWQRPDQHPGAPRAMMISTGLDHGPGTCTAAGTAGALRLTSESDSLVGQSCRAGWGSGPRRRRGPSPPTRRPRPRRAGPGVPGRSRASSPVRAARWPRGCRCPARHRSSDPRLEEQQSEGVVALEVRARSGEGAGVGPVLPHRHQRRPHLLPGAAYGRGAQRQAPQRQTLGHHGLLVGLARHLAHLHRPTSTGAMPARPPTDRRHHVLATPGGPGEAAGRRPGAGEARRRHQRAPTVAAALGRPRRPLPTYPADDPLRSRRSTSAELYDGGPKGSRPGHLVAARSGAARFSVSGCARWRRGSGLGAPSRGGRRPRRARRSGAGCP